MRPSVIESGGIFKCNKSNPLTKERCQFSDKSILVVLDHIAVEHFISKHKATRRRNIERLLKPDAVQQRDIRQAINEAKIFGNPHKRC